MMSIETIKIKFLEEFITLRDEKLIRKLYETLQSEKRSKKAPSGAKQKKKPALSDFAGIWNDEEAQQMQQAIEECRKIDLNEW